MEELLEANELAHVVVDIISGKKASNILMLDMKEITFLADYFILCDGSSTRQIKAISEAIRKELKGSTAKLSIEGTPDSGWMLVDLNSVIVHIFSPAQREYYQLDELWQNAPIVVRML